MNARFVEPALEQGRDQLNESRRRLGLPPRPYVHTMLSRELTLVATLPQLEYPRDWPSWARVVGPLMWEPPGEKVEPPPGDGPVVLVAPSTAQDREHRLLRAALEGLAGEPVRVIATWNGREPDPPIDVAAQRGARPVAVLLADDAAVRRRRLPRRPRHARARARQRLPGRRLPGGRRHGRERLARRLGRRSACGSRAASRRRAACARRSPARWRAAAARARAARSPRWVAANDGGARAAAELEAWADGRAHAAREAQPGLLDDPGR